MGVRQEGFRELGRLHTQRRKDSESEAPGHGCATHLQVPLRCDCGRSEHHDGSRVVLPLRPADGERERACGSGGE